MKKKYIIAILIGIGLFAIAGAVTTFALDGPHKITPSPPEPGTEEYEKSEIIDISGELESDED